MPEPLSQSLTHRLERGASERTLNELLPLPGVSMVVLGGGA